MSAANYYSSAKTSVQNASAQVGTVFRGLGAGYKRTAGELGTEISTTLTNTPKQIGDKILSLPKDITNIPVARDLSLPKLGDIVSRGKPDEMQQALENIVGVKVRDITGFPQGASAPNIQKRIDDYMSSIKRQILSEIKMCIERWLQHIANEIPIIGILADLEGYIERRISKYRLKLQRKIRSKIEEIAHEKLKLWQLSVMRQKLLEYVRKMCPDTHRLGGSGEHWKSLSPTLLHRLQTDDTWKIVDGTTDVEVLLDSHSSKSVAWSSSDNNTARMLDQIIRDASKAIETDAIIQSRGFNNATWSDFIDDSGVVRVDYINSDGTLVTQNEVRKLVTCES